MIRCVKCGKLYDYKKCDGICPNCARYNRPDSSELEQDLHERYDSTPNVHSAQAHEEAHRRNYDNTSHYTNDDGAQQYMYQSMAGEKKKPPVAKIAIISIVTIVVIIAIVFVALVIGVIRDEVSSYDDYDNIYDDGYTYEETEGVYLEYGWTTELGSNLARLDWDGSTLSLTDEEKQAFIEQETARADAEPGCYYVMTLEIQNNSDEDLDLTGVTKEDVSIFMDDNQLECRLVSLSYYELIEADDYGYVDCVFFLSDDEYQAYADGTEFEISGNIYVGDGQLSETDNQFEFSFEDYFYTYDYDEESYDDSYDDDDFDYDYNWDYEWGDDIDSGIMNL